MKKFKRAYAAIVVLIVGLVILGYVILSNIPGNLAPVGPEPVNLEVVTEKTTYAQGENVTFLIYENNTQDWAVYKPTAYGYWVSNSQGNVVWESGGFHVDFPPSNNTYPAHYGNAWRAIWDQTVTIDNRTTMAPPGDYTFTYLIDAPYIVQANCAVTIKPAE
ncbi:MAG: hypothetical protein NWE95_06665 [Candidatus Bathyarchaeota archaeon]|nr:hypothetical protein [Candidatus Bathyarchaeota archaeon]